jgi:hypothetical protein
MYVGLSHHCMAHAGVTDEQPPILMVAANILNRQSRTADTGGPPAWGLDEALKTPYRKIWTCYESCHLI